MNSKQDHRQVKLVFKSNETEMTSIGTQTIKEEPNEIGVVNFPASINVELSIRTKWTSRNVEDRKIDLYFYIYELNYGRSQLRVYFMELGDYIKLVESLYLTIKLKVDGPWELNWTVQKTESIQSAKMDGPELDDLKGLN